MTFWCDLHEGLKDNPRSQFIGRACIVAKPIGAADQELYDASGGQAGWRVGLRLRFKTPDRSVRVNEPLHDALSKSPAAMDLARRYQDVAADLSSQLRSLQSPKDNWGVLEVNEPLLQLRTPAPSEYCKLVFDDDGSVRCTTYIQFRELRSLQPGLAIGTCLSILAVLRLIQNKIEKGRVWDVAIGITDVWNLRAMPLLAGHAPTPDIPFGSDRYERARRVTGIQLEKDPWGIVRDLTGRFIEGCGLGFDGEARVLGYEP